MVDQDPTTAHTDTKINTLERQLHGGSTFIEFQLQPKTFTTKAWFCPSKRQLPIFKPLTPREIHNMYLGKEVQELWDWIKSFNTVQPLFVTSGKMNIINFHIYYKRRIVFYNCIDAPDKIHDANYNEGLMDTMVAKVGPKFVTVSPDNSGANFKVDQ